MYVLYRGGPVFLYWAPFIETPKTHSIHFEYLCELKKGLIMKVFSLVSVLLFGQVGFCQENHRVSNPLIFQEIHMDYQPMEVILDSLATHFKVRFVNPQNFNDIASLQGCIDEGLSVLLRRMALFHPFRFISTDTAIIILPLKDGDVVGK